MLADPEGNEFCVIEPGNNFLADCGFIGALAERRFAGRSGTSGARRWAGRWSGTRTRRPRSAHRTAVRRSRGAVRPCAPKTGKNRLHFDLAPPADGDQQAEVDRLVSLGATRIDIGQGEVGWVVLADPDGNEFCVLPPRIARRLGVLRRRRCPPRRRRSIGRPCTYPAGSLPSVGPSASHRANPTGSRRSSSSSVSSRRRHERLPAPPRRGGPASAAVVRIHSRPSSAVVRAVTGGSRLAGSAACGVAPGRWSSGRRGRRRRDRRSTAPPGRALGPCGHEVPTTARAHVRTATAPPASAAIPASSSRTPTVAAPTAAGRLQGRPGGGPGRLPGDAGRHAAGQHPGDADGDASRGPRRPSPPARRGRRRRGRRPTSARGEGSAEGHGQPPGARRDRTARTPSGPRPPVQRTRSAGHYPVRARMHTGDVTGSSLRPRGRGRLEGGRIPPLPEVRRDDVDPDRPARRRGRRFPRRPGGGLRGPPAPRCSSVSTARSAVSAPSGGRPTRRPGERSPADRARPPRPGGTAAAATAPRRRKCPARGGSSRRPTPSPGTPRPGVRSVTEVVPGDADHVAAAAATEGQLVVLGKSTTGARRRAGARLRSPSASPPGRRSRSSSCPAARGRARRPADRGRPGRRRARRRRTGGQVRRGGCGVEPAPPSRSCRSALARARCPTAGSQHEAEWARALPGPRGAPHRTARRDGRPGAHGDLPRSADGAQRRARLPAAPQSRRPAPLAAAALHLAHGARAAGAPTRAGPARGDLRRSADPIARSPDPAASRNLTAALQR